MTIGLRWHGLKELRAQLATVATDLRDAATPIADAHAHGAAADMRSRYPRVTGRLAASVVVRDPRTRGPATVAVRVTNTAPYAHYFEYGTRYMAPGRVFVPTVNQERRDMVRVVAADVLPAFNFRAKGDAAD
jgi:HK97 gp10 family phage protein